MPNLVSHQHDSITIEWTEEASYKYLVSLWESGMSESARPDFIVVDDRTTYTFRKLKPDTLYEAAVKRRYTPTDRISIPSVSLEVFTNPLEPQVELVELTAHTALFKLMKQSAENEV